MTGEQAEAIWQDWVENQLPTFVASSDYIEDTTLPVLASDGVSFPAIMRLVQAERAYLEVSIHVLKHSSSGQHTERRRLGSGARYTV